MRRCNEKCRRPGRAFCKSIVPIHVPIGNQAQLHRPAAAVFDRAGEEAAGLGATLKLGKIGLKDVTAMAFFVWGWDAIDPSTNASILRCAGNRTTAAGRAWASGLATRTCSQRVRRATPSPSSVSLSTMRCRCGLARANFYFWPLA